MKVAVISDVHGNAPALDAVLADIDAEGVDAILNLGDHVAGPIEPGRTMGMLRSRPMLAIRGNTDRILIEEPAALDDLDRRVLAELSADDRAWLTALPATAVYADTIFLAHGTAASDEIYWLDRAEGDHFRPATQDEVMAELPDVDLPLYCCGHSHVARVVRLADGRIVFNPGSVGRPSFAMVDPESAGRVSPDAAYAIVSHRDGAWDIDLRQIRYDNQSAARMARDGWGSPKWAQNLLEGRRR